MKFVLTIITAAIILCSNANANTLLLRLSPFTQVNIHNNIQLHIHFSKHQQVTVTGSQQALQNLQSSVQAQAPS